MLRKPRLTVLTVVAMFAFAAVLVACGGVEPSTEELVSTPAETTETLPTAPPEPPLHVSTQKVTGKEKAVLTTDKGVIEIEFYADKAPNTTASFIELVNKEFYDGTKFHRVEPGLLIQGGDPLSKSDSPAVGSGDPGWRLKAEFNDISHAIGTVAMARTESPDTAGSQFYICLSPLTQLDGQYTVFGHVVKGMDVAEKVSVGTIIESAKIVTAP